MRRATVSQDANVRSASAEGIDIASYLRFAMNTAQFLSYFRSPYIAAANPLRSPPVFDIRMRCKIMRHVQPDGMSARVKHPSEGVAFLAVRCRVPCNDRQIRSIVVTQIRYVVAHHVPHFFVSFLHIPISEFAV